ncbi:type II CAAX endopeptidase family protein [Anaerocolumna sp. AGMB13020]|uniref:CPBP family intramembrane glutamic endopeptidase n=1 Tax=Anaerocolumna sp. AGMB13020 TaxID=3081750 RepID=UPI0029546161|nr:type II CAAX endopeptidase family protein [Anaerocolumna sp. AGMB13020]WOO38873.1 type II CAAX endopeptidase family protein [Anaerocolumna sp. AGMB13020]
MNQVKSVNRVFLATVLITFAGIIINPWVYDRTNNIIFALIISQLLLIIPSVIYLIKSKEGLSQAIGFHKISVGNVVLLVILTFLIMPLMGLINSISMLFVRNDTTAVIDNLIGNNGFWISLLMVAVVPCIFEESVYRGVLFQNYRKANPLKGIFISGLLFGLIHQNFNQFSYAFVLGMIFALIIEATGSILSTMIVHFIINGTSVVSLTLYPKLLELSDGMTGNGVSQEEVMQAAAEITPVYIISVLLPLAVVSTVIAFFVFRVLADNSGRWEHIKSIFRKKEPVAENGDESEKVRFVTPSLVIGIIVCILIMIASELAGSGANEAASREGYTTVILGFIYNIKNYLI